MEREANVPKRRLKSRVYIKVYEIRPGEGQAGLALEKRRVAAFFHPDAPVPPQVGQL